MISHLIHTILGERGNKMKKHTITKFFTINPTKVKMAFILALLLMSLLVPELALAGPSPGSTGG